MHACDGPNSWCETRTVLKLRMTVYFFVVAVFLLVFLAFFCIHACMNECACADRIHVFSAYQNASNHLVNNSTYSPEQKQM